MNRKFIMDTLNILPENFEIADFLEALYERVQAFEGIVDAENGKERPIENIIKEFDK